MKVVLSSQIPVERIAVFAEMGWMERRPELGLICRAARDNGNRISLSTVQTALPGLQDAGATNVISWCRMLRLCDTQGGLTALGEEVAETDEAPIPEQGVYSLWLAQHPVIGRRLLAVERRASTRDQRFEDVQPLPIEPDRDKVFRSVVDSKERYQVRDLPTNHKQGGCLIEKTSATCRLRWILDFDTACDHWQLDGMIEAPQGRGRYVTKPMEHTPESAGLDLWRLAESWGSGPLSAFGRWNPNSRRLEVAFKGLTEEEQDCFRKTMKLDRVEITGKGVFQNATLEDTPIAPMDKDEAQEWAMSCTGRYLLMKPGYRSRGELRQLFADLTDGTPLEMYSPSLPSHDKLVGGQLYTKKPELFWSLTAPVDLSPRPVASDELAAFRIGTPATKVISEIPGVLRIPYRGGWSMRQFIDRVMAGVEPRKVLLCDRYVRGVANVEMLKLFVQSVHTINPSATIEVWTSDEEADLKQIQKITGTLPRAYREVFGRNFPHDRYLLVHPSKIAGFGWHMTNSPLHARADNMDITADSPLRWKDFAGTRVSPDELDQIGRAHV